MKQSPMSSASPSLFRTAAVTTMLILSISAGCSGSSNDSSSPSPSPTPGTTSAGVFTYHNDNARTGQNLQEAILTPANVDATKFGKLFSYPVDGRVYTQPLYMPNVNIGGQLHNVVFAATAHDSVYAFDADNPVSPPLRQTSFINPPGMTSVPSSDYACNEIQPEMGIISTPVIDPASGTLYYVVAMTKETGPTYLFRLHALSVNTGAEVGTGHVVIQASVPGTGDGNVFVITGNGTFDGPSPAGNNNLSDSFLRLVGGTLKLLDFFTPFNQADLAALDLDLGSSAPVLLPDQPGLHPHLMVGGGKEGRIYLVNRDNMGHFQAGSDSQIVQKVPGQLAFDPSTGSLFTAPAYFNNTVYFLANQDVLKAFSLVNGLLSTSPVSQATTQFGYPGGLARDLSQRLKQWDCVGDRERQHGGATCLLSSERWE
jgi:hypothetical protein